MASFYLEATLETRRQRLPYLIVSLVILPLTSAVAVLDGLYTYHVLYSIIPGPENIEANLEVAFSSWNQLVVPAGLVRDISIRIADAVLVSPTFRVKYHN